MTVLAREEWLALRENHHKIVDQWIAPRLQRRSTQLKHPVDDFLFDYYPFSPNKLRTWHPGAAFELIAKRSDIQYFSNAQYQFTENRIASNPVWRDKNLQLIRSTQSFLEAVAKRPARGGCFGLHEWAMVLDQSTTRHSEYPLRLSQDEIKSTIDEQGLRCTHFDAFRFFTDTARPLNPLQLAYDDKFKFEQPGCLHANMDLYKYASRLVPLTGSLFLRDCFVLARDIRTVDMQVAPYDLSSLGVQPIRVEDEEGRQEFTKKQQEFSARAHELRQQLIAFCQGMVGVG